MEISTVPVLYLLYTYIIRSTFSIGGGKPWAKTKKRDPEKQDSEDVAPPNYSKRETSSSCAVRRCVRAVLHARQRVYGPSLFTIHYSPMCTLSLHGRLATNMLAVPPTTPSSPPSRCDILSTRAETRGKTACMWWVGESPVYRKLSIFVIHYFSFVIASRFHHNLSFVFTESCD